jgi:hypothetical protein
MQPEEETKRKMMDILKRFHTDDEDEVPSDDEDGELFVFLVVDLNFMSGTWVDLVSSGNAISQRTYTLLLELHDKQQVEKTLAFK